jgi:hypothetical protein
MCIANIEEMNGRLGPIKDPLDMWDENDNGPESNVPGTVPEDPDRPAQMKTSALSIEDRPIPLPSNGTVSQVYAELELGHRILHAEYHLNRIRDLIAEKSFQYSHVIRVSPRKGINTRSRATVKKLTLQILLHSRMYSRSWSCLQPLGADPATLLRFRKLTPDDVKASTAIVNPNEPGSTRLKLSWIWQTAGGHRWGLGTGTDEASGDVPDGDVLECMFFYYRFRKLNIKNSSTCSLAPCSCPTYEVARTSYTHRI